MSSPAPIRLDVRLHGGPAIGYPVNSEFLVGSAVGCDLRLPDSSQPPVVCQLSLSEHGLYVRRRAAAEVTHNQSPLQESAAVADGDILTIGAVEITIVSTAKPLLHPRLQALDEQPDPRQAALDEQARELEEDRRLWYRRRQEIEAEIGQLRAHASDIAIQHGTHLELSLQAREAAVTRRAAELQQFEAELAEARQTLSTDYETKRDELQHLNAQVQSGRAQLEARQTQAEHDATHQLQEAMAEFVRERLAFETQVQDFEPQSAQLRRDREHCDRIRKSVEEDRAELLGLRDEIARDRATLDSHRQWHLEQSDQNADDLARRESDLIRLAAHLESEKVSFDAERVSHKDDLLRLNRWKGELEELQTRLAFQAAEIDERGSQLKTDAAELEDQLRLAAADANRLQDEHDRLDRLRTELEMQSEKFTERAGLVESQQAMLAVQRAKLDRQQSELLRDIETFNNERQHQTDTRRILDDKLRDAEMLRSELGFLQDDHAAKERAVHEQQTLLNATLDEFRHQKDAVAAAEMRLAERERELDDRTSVVAEQAATLKSKLFQALELQQRLESDRTAVRERELALSEAEVARQELQEQLRKRADDLGGRRQHLDSASQSLAEEKAALAHLRGGIDDHRTQAESDLARLRGDLETRAAEVDCQTQALVERETALARQVARMKDVGTAMAAERKSLFDAKQHELADRQDAQAFQYRIAEQVAELRRQAPELEHRAEAASAKLATARDMLRGHLSELQESARQSQQALQAEREQLQQREQKFEEARAEHRISVSDFRTQLHDWQAKVSSLKQSLKTQDARFTDRQAELDAATVRLQASQQDLERRMVEIAAEQQLANDKRNEMERHLADMREWYRQKLRSLASGRSVDDSDMPSWESVAPTPAPMVFPKDTSKLRNDQAAVARNEADDDRDSQLGETLRSRGLVDSAALMALSNEARRQRKTLRQTLLASGVVTLYQLALIEAGNLGDLTLGRFRVIDRVRATPRENIYRVFDPQRGHLATLLRVLTDDEGRNEFTERFKAASEARHANLACVYEVLEIDGRPAALVEALTGVPSSDWPALAASPGVWLKLVSDAASALAHIHSIGLVHGRLTPDQFVLSAEGVLKVLGLGEPGVALFDPRPAGDLRSLGRVAFGWSQIGAKRRIGKGKAFPSELAVLLRRLEAGAENGMGDVISLDRPFADAAEIVSELEKLSVDHPCPPEAWSKLVQSVSESQPLRQSA